MVRWTSLETLSDCAYFLPLFHADGVLGHFVLVMFLPDSLGAHRVADSSLLPLSRYFRIRFRSRRISCPTQVTH